MPSIFSRIISGEIPASKIYEDDKTFAFLDIAPASRGHTLVVPKEEYPDLFSIPPETLAAVMRTVQRLALVLRDTLTPDGLNIVQNNGAAAGQTVFHYHVHLIPRWDGDHALPLWKPGQATPQELHALAETLRTKIADSTEG